MAHVPELLISWDDLGMGPSIGFHMDNKASPAGKAE
jgi:hypothetical protein